MKRKKRIVLYALSTCIWCKRTKRLLAELGVDYESIDVDLLSSSQAAGVREYLDGITSEGSYPVLVVNDDEVIEGFDEDRIREALS
jgi:glutaredoxin-like protein NrdH